MMISVKSRSEGKLDVRLVLRRILTLFIFLHLFHVHVAW